MWCTTKILKQILGGRRMKKRNNLDIIIIVTTLILKVLQFLRNTFSKQYKEYRIGVKNGTRNSKRDR